ncbi:MAG: protein translocase subunit SecD [Propionibacteriaceae bacterium]
MATNTSRPGRILVAFIVVTAGLFGLMAATGSWTPKLGLDLRGGTTITLTARNTDGGGSIDQNSLAQAKQIIQNRVDSLGVGETEVTTSGDRQIVVTVPTQQQDQLVTLVGQTAELTFRAVYQAEMVQPATDPSAAPSGSPDPSADPSGAAEPSATAEPSGEAEEPSPEPSATNRRPGPNLPTAPPAPETPRPTEEGQGTPPEEGLEWQPSEQDMADFAAFTCDNADEFVEVSDQVLFSCSQEGDVKYLLGPALLKGEQLVDANAGMPQNQLNWVVDLELNGEGAAQFEEVTGYLSGQQQPMNQFAIVLDGETVSAPSVENPIPGGRAQISGNFNQQSAQDLANILKYGALPLAFDVDSVDNVSASLGGEQLEAGMIAGLVGLALVVLFAFAYYRGLGIVVVASLGIAGLLTYAMVVLLGESVGFALNLPGIAGAIVAIGVTADSFIIYFERIRDEVREGRSLRSAVETGWVRARQTVLIADAVSLLSAVILFVLAIGSVKGFAFTLGLTTLIDIAIVFWFTKPLMSVLARTKFFGRGHKLSGLDPAHLGVKELPGQRRGTKAKIASGSASTSSKEA